MKRWLVLSTVLSILLLLVLPACGGSGGDEDQIQESSAAAFSTPTPSSTLTPTATPTPVGPVKIGAIMPWSGPMAAAGLLADQVIAVIEMQLQEQGGILGGREVKFVRGDDRAAVAETSAQAKKLILEDKVSAIVFGSIGTSFYTAVADVAEEYKTPFVPIATVFNVETRKYSVSMVPPNIFISRLIHFITDYVKPKTVGWLAGDSENFHMQLDGREGVEGAKKYWEDAGINVVYEQWYSPDISDFSPFLTKIKYVNPDILISDITVNDQAIAINKQITELGGWGDIQYWSAAEGGSNKVAIKLPSAQGTYVSVLWLPGSSEPGMKTFEDAFVKKHGRLPEPSVVYYYNSAWTAIKAIELAGTDDRDAVAAALRSGKLEWDSAAGPLSIDANGNGHMNLSVAQVQAGGTLTLVWP